MPDRSVNSSTTDRELAEAMLRDVEAMDKEIVGENPRLADPEYTPDYEDEVKRTAVVKDLMVSFHNFRDEYRQLVSAFTSPLPDRSQDDDDPEDTAKRKTGTDHKEKLAALRVEHRDLDDVLEQLTANIYVDQLQIKRLKKRKLQLKDSIARLESLLTAEVK